MSITKKKNTKAAESKAAAIEEDDTLRSSSLAYVLKTLSRNPSAMFGIITLTFIIVMSFVQPTFGYGYNELNLRLKCAAPSAAHWFGCDELGRDIFARVFYGARYTLSIGVVSVALAAVSGIILGSICGYFGGFVDALIMRLLDILQTFPQMLLAIVVASALGTGIGNTILALGISLIPAFARMMRANILTIRSNEYIEAAVSINCRTVRIIWRHVLPNAISPLIVQISMSIANQGLHVSALSFIGLGIEAPLPEWGSMLASARTFMRDYPHMMIFPGLFIMLSVLSLNLIGDGIRDALDPKMKE